MKQTKGIEGSWVHAYLHHKEGDQGNAAYWYSRAGKPVCREPLDAEWLSIVTLLLGQCGFVLLVFRKCRRGRHFLYPNAFYRSTIPVARKPEQFITNWSALRVCDV